MTPFITMPHDPFHHSPPGPHLSECSKAPVITMTHDTVMSMLFGTCHHNTPCPLSLQFSMALVITMLHGAFHYNAQGQLSSLCSMPRVITMPNAHCHHNAPCHLSSQCTMHLSAQCSLVPVIKMLHALVITMLQISSHHNAPCPCLHNAP